MLTVKYLLLFFLKKITLKHKRVEVETQECEISCIDENSILIFGKNLGTILRYYFLSFPLKIQSCGMWLFFSCDEVYF